jgi:hypothetical protein
MLEPGRTMAIKSPTKKEGYAAWFLAKVFDELTGNYYRNAAAESQTKPPLVNENPRTPEENTVCVEELDGSNGAALDR